MNVCALAHKLDFQVDYLPKSTLHDIPISSGRIRAYIAEGAFDKAQECLGRPYSILGPLIQEADGCFLNAKQLCLPPQGSYPIRLKVNLEEHPAQATIDPQKGLIRINCPLQNPLLPNCEAELIFLYTR